jgi:hypothetical protein
MKLVFVGKPAGDRTGGAAEALKHRVRFSATRLQRKDVCGLLPLMRSPSTDPLLNASAWLPALWPAPPCCSAVRRPARHPRRQPAAPASHGGATEAADDKMQVRNNASSLLAQLLDQEKNVSKVLIIKHGSRELSGLIKAISTAAADGAKRLKGLAQVDPTLDLRRQGCPPARRRVGMARARRTSTTCCSRVA